MDERARRWRLVLGGASEGALQGADAGMDAALAALYERGAGLGASAPRVARWLGDIREYFPSTVVHVMQKDAIERLNLTRLLLEPEMLEAVEPDVHLVGTLLSLNRVMPDKARESARVVVRKVVAELEARLERRTRAAVTGALDRSARTHRPRRAADIDWNRTIKANLKNYLPERNTVVPSRLVGYGRRQQAVQREVVLCIDQSGSMAASVVYASVFGAVLASMRSLRTSLVVFDTAVVDLTDQLHDPVEVLFGTQLGGGTDINRAIAYCQGLVTRPADTIFLLISDLYEGGVREEMLRRVAAMTDAGVQVIVLLALSDEGTPGYDHDNAAALAQMGVPAFACTPDAFPELMAAAIERRSYDQRPMAAPAATRKVHDMPATLTESDVFSPRLRALSAGMIALSTLVAFEYLAVATAMPVVGRELDGYHLYGLAFSGGLAAGVIATVAGGRWSDAKGPRAPLWTGVAAFMGGLLIAGTAPTMEVFLAGRFIQGLGGGLFNVALYVLVAQVYPAQAHPRVFSLLAAAWVLPSVVGPAITGIVAEHLSWRWVFLGVPVLAAPAALVLWRGLPKGTAPPAGADGNRDFVPALAWGAVAAVGAALLQYGSGTSWPGSSLAIAGLALLALALPRLLPPGTLRAARGLPAVVALRGLAAGAFFATEVFVPLALMTERGLSPAQAGIALTGGALAWSLGSWIQGRGSFGRAAVLRVGTALIAAGIAFTALAVFDSVPVLAAFAGWVLAGLGVGLVYPTLSVLVLELSAPGEEGRNSASLSIGESVFSIIAVAATGAIFAGFGGTLAVYLVCFALLVVMAGTGAAVAGRFDHAR